MNVHANITDLEDRAGHAFGHDMPLGIEPLQALKAQLDDLQETLADIEFIGGENGARKVAAMSRELDGFTPEVTFIGQIKSGKTTLVNAMAGRPDLLPADVNPWTSVVTSLQLNVAPGDDDAVAEFKFFDAKEWDDLMEHGGRIGELSERIGADQERDKLIEQVAQMRESTKARLGRKFELLLGQTHRFQDCDPELIKRYVCLGDDFDLEGNGASASKASKDRSGQFADITKTAQIRLEAPFLPTNLVMRDTPGLNDTFMMREQITIRAIRDSQTCVVVLSAHQALNSVDLGLIRLISTVKSRQVVIFVNRIDELEDPAQQAGEIRESILATLKAHNGPENPDIVFGSAIWANAVLTGTVAALPEDSLLSLGAYGDSTGLGNPLTSPDCDTLTWIASGVPALYQILTTRIAEHSGQIALDAVRKRARNMVMGLKASSKVVSVAANGGQIRKLDDEGVTALMDQIGHRARERLSYVLDKFASDFGARIDQASERFVSRATASLIKDLDRYGEAENWNYSPDGLRILARSAYQLMTSRLCKNVRSSLQNTAGDLADGYGQIFDVTLEDFEVEVPNLPDIPPPVTIAQTIVLDIKTPWWKSWAKKRKGFAVFEKDFRALIEQETAPILDELKTGQIQIIRGLMETTLAKFLTEQQSVLADVLEKSKISLEDLQGLFGVTSQAERDELFDILFDELDIDEIDIEEAA